MRNVSRWRWIGVAVAVAGVGCAPNPNLGTGLGGGPFATGPGFSGLSRPGGGPALATQPFASGPFASVPQINPSEQVRQLENWRSQVTAEYQKTQRQLAGLQQRNKTLEEQIANSRRHAKLQDDHLRGVSSRLKESSAELAQIKAQGGRVETLDKINQEKERQLAAARQDVQRLEAQLATLQKQFQQTRSELAGAMSAKTDAEKRAEAMLASSRRRPGATIAANTNLALRDFNLPGVEVRRDGDVIRVQLPSSDLFEPSSVRLSSRAQSTLRQIALELDGAFPGHMIGVEGHAGSGAIPVGPWRDSHHYSSAQAMAVYELLTAGGLLSRNRLHVVGHGNNHPVYSNATAAGQRLNQRVELVVYPETK